MPVTIYQSADAAARNNKLEQHVPDTYGTSVIVSITDLFNSAPLET